MVTYSRDFPGRPEQVRLARRFVTGFVPPRSDTLTAAELLVTEAATNALLHSASGASGGSFRVTCRVGDGLLRVDVSDDGAPSGPTRKVHGPDSVTGRGLELFAALADRWGVEGDAGGRTVWFELPVKEVSEGGADDRAVRPRTARPQPGPLRGDPARGATARLAA